MSHELIFEYFELFTSNYSMFNYLLNELLLIKTDLVFVELFNFRLSSRKTQSFPEFILIPTGLLQEPQV